MLVFSSDRLAPTRMHLGLRKLPKVFHVRAFGIDAPHRSLFALGPIARSPTCRRESLTGRERARSLRRQDTVFDWTWRETELCVAYILGTGQSSRREATTRGYRAR